MKAYIPGRGLSVWRWYATPCRIHQPYHRPMSRFRPLGPPSLPLPSVQSPRPIPAYLGRAWNLKQCIYTNRVLGFLSSRPNWVLAPPHPQASAPPFGSRGGHTRLRSAPTPPLVPGGGGAHSLAGERAGEANSDEVTDTLALMYTISINPLRATYPDPPFC